MGSYPCLEAPLRERPDLLCILPYSPPETPIFITFTFFFSLGGKHTMEYTNVVLQSCTVEISMTPSPLSSTFFFVDFISLQTHSTC